MKIRSLKIYALPDGREFIAETFFGDRISLYSERSWASYGLAEYYVGADGHLLSDGKKTDWHVGQLVDTGREAKYPPARRLL
jgi:hypothetical protein